MTRVSLCRKSRLINSFFWKPITRLSSIDGRLPILVRIEQDRVNPYDFLGRFLGCIAVLNLLDGLLCYEFYAIAFSHQFFEVYLPSKAIISVMCVRPMEGTVPSDIPLGRISLQEGWSLHPRLVLHLGENLMHGMEDLV
ncbi:unnamed protein product [Prunus armeniaca]